MRHNPALDGLRAIAAILVVAFHCGVPLAPGGMIGVDIFFVLSGYLVTSILRRELHAVGQIRIWTFYSRRILRLCPPLFLFLGIYVLVGQLLFSDVDVRSGALIAGFYVTDYSMAIWKTPIELSHTWSLSVEQHFYMLWPLAIMATRKMSDATFARFLVAGFVLSTGWRMMDVLIWHDWAWTYYRFDTRLSGLLLGSALAGIKLNLTGRQAAALGRMSAYVLLFAVAVLRVRTEFSLVWGGLMVDLGAAGLILSLVSGHVTPLSRILSNPVLVYLGAISYSIYLWHYPIALALRDELNSIAAFAIVIAIAIAIAAASDRLLERPLRMAGNRSLIRAP